MSICAYFSLFRINQELRSVVTSQKKERNVIQEVLYRKTVCAALRNASLRRVPYAGDYQLPSSPFYQRPTQPALQALGSSGHEKKRAREKETRDTPRVSPSRACSLFRPLLPSACYAASLPQRCSWGFVARSCVINFCSANLTTQIFF